MKRNTIICIAGIAVSIMLLFSLVQIGELIISNYKNMILSVSNYDYFISDLDKETADEIQERYQSRYQTAQFIFWARSLENAALQGIDRTQLGEYPAYIEYILMNSNGFPKEEDSFELYSYLFETYGRDIMPNIQVNERKLELESDQGIYHLLSVAIWGIVIFIAVVMTIFIYYMMQISFQNKMNQYGTMRALGAGNANIGRIILSELFIYGCVGLSLGCLAGILFNKIFAKTFIRIFVGDQIDRIQTSYRMVLYVMGLVTVSVKTT